ncbi:hypothetical protein Hanom_Chr07g00649871 [Helianthus anomalus]
MLSNILRFHHPPVETTVAAASGTDQRTLSPLSRACHKLPTTIKSVSTNLKGEVSLTLFIPHMYPNIV